MNKTPFIHITKRMDVGRPRAYLFRAVSILLAFVVIGIVTTILTGENPFAVYTSLFNGALGSVRKVWVLFQNLSILLCVGLALAPAFRMRFWNLGGDGQVLVGCIAASCVMLFLGKTVPHGLLIVLTLVASITAGALWGLIPAFFKAKWNTNETLFTLMMNYVAAQLASFFITSWSKDGSAKIGIINPQTHAGWLPEIGNKYLLIILIVTTLTVLMYVYMKYTKQGYEISVVGESERTAKYIGIKVNKVILRTMILSGALCGLTGFLLVSAKDHTLTTTMVDGRGFTAVIVAWLAKFNPFTMILTAFLIVFLNLGSNQITTTLGLNSSFGDIITGIILFFIIGSEFFINYKISFPRFAKGDE